MNKFVVIAIIVVIITAILLMSNREKFYPYIGYKRYCTECGTKNIIDCGKCTNCVKCITPSGSMKCVDGDINGPYFASDCVNWKYGTNTDYSPVVVSEVVPYFDWLNPYRWYGNNNRSYHSYRPRHRTRSRGGIPHNGGVRRRH